MSDFTDRELGMDRPITRRDFVNGMAVGIGALGAAGLVFAEVANLALDGVAEAVGLVAHVGFLLATTVFGSVTLSGVVS